MNILNCCILFKIYKPLASARGLTFNFANLVEQIITDISEQKEFSGTYFIVRKKLGKVRK